MQDKREYPKANNHTMRGEPQSFKKDGERGNDDMQISRVAAPLRVGRESNLSYLRKVLDNSDGSNRQSIPIDIRSNDNEATNSLKLNP